MLVMLMCKKHRNVFDDHIYNVSNDTHNPYKIVIINYTERVHEMFDMSNLLPPPFRKNE